MKKNILFISLIFVIMLYLCLTSCSLQEKPDVTTDATLETSAEMQPPVTTSARDSFDITCPPFTSSLWKTEHEGYSALDQWVIVGDKSLLPKYEEYAFDTAKVAEEECGDISRIMDKVKSYGYPVFYKDGEEVTERNWKTSDIFWDSFIYFYPEVHSSLPQGYDMTFVLRQLYPEENDIAVKSFYFDLAYIPEEFRELAKNDPIACIQKMRNIKLNDNDAFSGYISGYGYSDAIVWRIREISVFGKKYQAITYDKVAGKGSTKWNETNVTYDYLSGMFLSGCFYIIEGDMLFHIEGSYNDEVIRDFYQNLELKFEFPDKNRYVDCYWYERYKEEYEK